MVDVQTVRCAYYPEGRDGDEKQKTRKRFAVWYIERSKTVFVNPNFDMYTEPNFAVNVVELYLDKTDVKYTFTNGPKNLAVYFSDADYTIIPYDARDPDALRSKRNAWYTKYARLSSDSLFVPETKMIPESGEEESFRHGRCALRSKLAITGRSVSDKKNV